ncbi:MAG: MBL fold metallo-hydrolase [Aquabacterium sp.]|nr:MBL fold metallo-hydrolase [Aquabacterium sp.]
MSHAPAALHYPFDQAVPEPGRVLQIADGVLWLRMAMPFALNHINLWLLRDRLDGREGWTIVDCGLGQPDVRQQWEQVFASALDGLPVLRVIVTHMHPDHIGSAAWLTERWSTPQQACRAWISAGDYFAAQLAMNHDADAGGDRAADFFASHGLTDPAAQAGVRERAGYYRHLVPALPPQHVRLLGGQELRIGDDSWHCIAGYGHAPEHISLHCPARGLYIAGDMLLPRISTNVSVHNNEPEGDPLSLYLDSLAVLARLLPPQTLVLPSHGLPFGGEQAADGQGGAHTRINELACHHDERLQETLHACRQQPTSAADLLPVLFRRQLDLHQTTFAMGEALAHLHRLWLAGELRRERGADGVYRFSLA